MSVVLLLLVVLVLVVPVLAVPVLLALFVEVMWRRCWCWWCYYGKTATQPIHGHTVTACLFFYHAKTHTLATTGSNSYALFSFFNIVYLKVDRIGALHAASVSHGYTDVYLFTRSHLSWRDNQRAKGKGCRFGFTNNGKGGKVGDRSGNLVICGVNHARQLHPFACGRIVVSYHEVLLCYSCW